VIRRSSSPSTATSATRFAARLLDVFHSQERPLRILEVGANMPYETHPGCEGRPDESRR